MMIKIAACLLALGFLSGCSTTTTTAKRETLREQNARYASSAPATSNGLAPVAEGPEDVPKNESTDPNDNPGLVPSPLLRANAIGGL